METRLAARSNPGTAPLLSGGGSARLDLTATGNRDVRGQLSLNADLRAAAPGTAAGVAVRRAFLRARLPGFRLTAGKTRLSWGRGRFFNAGDVLFGQPPAFAAGAGEYLTAADWLVAAYVPLGRLSFLELVALPPLEALTIDRTTAGGRALARLGELTVEGGYLYAGQAVAAGEAAAGAGAAAREHRGYLSLKGALPGVDWHLSAGTALPAAPGADLRRAAADRLLLTGGGLAFLDLGPEAGALSLLLEAGVRPARPWAAEAATTPPAAAALDHYGLYLFPELGYRPADGWNLSLSGVVSPIDASGVAAAGASWNILQGLTLSLHAAAMFGAPEATFAWQRAGALSATLLARYVFGAA